MIEDALSQAVEIDFEGEVLRIFSLEYLMAIMIQTGRTKDKARLEDILGLEISFDRSKLHDILVQHRLLTKWEEFSEAPRS